MLKKISNVELEIAVNKEFMIRKEVKVELDDRDLWLLKGESTTEAIEKLQEISAKIKKENNLDDFPVIRFQPTCTYTGDVLLTLYYNTLEDEVTWNKRVKEAQRKIEKLEFKKMALLSELEQLKGYVNNPIT